MRPIAYMQEETGPHWRQYFQCPKNVALVLFDDGTIFDFVLMKLGYAPWRFIDYKPHIRVPMGREVT